MICPQQDIPPHALDAADGLCSQGHSVTVYCTKAPLRRVKDSPSPQYCQCDIGILRLLLLIPHPIMGIFVLFLRALCMTIRMFVASYYYDAIMLYNISQQSSSSPCPSVASISSIAGVPVVVMGVITPMGGYAQAGSAKECMRG
ncbi:hypothetical protein Pmar_PMAR010893 [Perkinsus marinus ATCC 50983]|uniref:Uncharacterized protein n=1 Tax=Perkinsus marinus (strain ATCC 50983 / TXsc) TaxID=423536 RepID=C5LU97_PERM5|nr:hypothetical protein Pmar_PMAR010893 [Perkinsus marinus ATCC 50983]EEQ99630.1 hypothetical protein Pmar_PMAR010893 [Perkinsus marinus ATCC 50983]|eukprot:XP_002766913.1 hypothetical protein Pmar_PMAR010893 [Perkinsus marinus ATCC 50983]